MARSFSSASTQYLERTGLSSFGAPLTLACWTKLNSTAVLQVLLACSEVSGGDLCELYITNAGKLALYAEQQGIGNISIIGTTTISTGTWTHVAVACSSGDSEIFVNGVSDGTSSTARTIGTLTQLHVGTRRYAGSLGDYTNGAIAEAVVYDKRLVAADINTLAKGYSPLFVCKNDIRAYWPLGGHYGQYDNDAWKNGYNLTAYNTPTWSDHPRVIYSNGSDHSFTAFPNYTKLLDVIHPTNYYTIGANYPYLKVRNSRECLSFNATTQQAAYFSRIMPRSYSGNGCCVYLYVAAATDTTSTFSFNAAFERVGNRIQDIDNNSFADTKNRYYETVPRTCGHIQCIKIPFTAAQMNNVQAGEMYTLRVQRAVAFDDATGDAELYAIEIRNP